jgi:hypothetical protein
MVVMCTVTQFIEIFLCRFLHIEKLESAIASVIQNKSNNVDDGSNQNINLSLETDILYEGHNIQYSHISVTKFRNNNADIAMCQCDISCDMSQYDTSLTVINASSNYAL